MGMYPLDALHVVPDSIGAVSIEIADGVSGRARPFERSRLS